MSPSMGQHHSRVMSGTDVHEGLHVQESAVRLPAVDVRSDSQENAAVVPDATSDVRFVACSGTVGGTPRRASPSWRHAWGDVRHCGSS